MRARNIALERELTDLAARAAGFPDAHGLSEYSDRRALAGGVEQRDFGREIREELADARNYSVWAIEAIYDLYVAGDPQAADDYERYMRTLTYLVRAWRELHTDSA